MLGTGLQDAHPEQRDLLLSRGPHARETAFLHTHAASVNEDCNRCYRDVSERAVSAKASACDQIASREKPEVNQVTGGDGIE